MAWRHMFALQRCSKAGAILARCKDVADTDRGWDKQHEEKEGACSHGGHPASEESLARLRVRPFYPLLILLITASKKFIATIGNLLRNQMEKSRTPK